MRTTRHAVLVIIAIFICFYAFVMAAEVKTHSDSIELQTIVAKWEHIANIPLTLITQIYTFTIPTIKIDQNNEFSPFNIGIINVFNHLPPQLFNNQSKMSTTFSLFHHPSTPLSDLFIPSSYKTHNTSHNSHDVDHVDDDDTALVDPSLQIVSKNLKQDDNVISSFESFLNDSSNSQGILPLEEISLGYNRWTDLGIDFTKLEQDSISFTIQLITTIAHANPDQFTKEMATVYLDQFRSAEKQHKKQPTNHLYINICSQHTPFEVNPDLKLGDIQHGNNPMELTVVPCTNVSQSLFHIANYHSQKIDYSGVLPQFDTIPSTIETNSSDIEWAEPLNSEDQGDFNNVDWNVVVETDFEINHNNSDLASTAADVQVEVSLSSGTIDLLFPEIDTPFVYDTETDNDEKPRESLFWYIVRGLGTILYDYMIPFGIAVIFAVIAVVMGRIIFKMITINRRQEHLDPTSASTASSSNGTESNRYDTSRTIIAVTGTNQDVMVFGRQDHITADVVYRYYNAINPTITANQNRNNTNVSGLHGNNVSEHNDSSQKSSDGSGYDAWPPCSTSHQSLLHNNVNGSSEVYLPIQDGLECQKNTTNPHQKTTQHHVTQKTIRLTFNTNGDEKPVAGTQQIKTINDPRFVPKEIFESIHRAELTSSNHNNIIDSESHDNTTIIQVKTKSTTTGSDDNSMNSDYDYSAISEVESNKKFDLVDTPLATVSPPLKPEPTRFASISTGISNIFSRLTTSKEDLEYRQSLLDLQEGLDGDEQYNVVS